MKRNIKLLMFLLIINLISCGGTDRYVVKPKLKIEGQSIDNEQALRSLFLNSNQIYKIHLCEADSNTKKCLSGSKGISARGVGGIFLPIFMDLKSLEVNQAKFDKDISFISRLDAKINNISPWCGTINGHINIDDMSANIALSDFYCNWVGIGNVLTNIDLSIDRVNAEDKTFAGFYKIAFYGTGNATGSGYYKATILPVTTTP